MTNADTEESSTALIFFLQFKKNSGESAKRMKINFFTKLIRLNDLTYRCVPSLCQLQGNNDEDYIPIAT